LKVNVFWFLLPFTKSQPNKYTFTLSNPCKMLSRMHSTNCIGVLVPLYTLHTFILSFFTFDSSSRSKCWTFINAHITTAKQKNNFVWWWFTVKWQWSLYNTNQHILDKFVPFAFRLLSGKFSEHFQLVIQSMRWNASIWRVSLRHTCKCPSFS